MGQLCSCTRAQDKRGRQWLNRTILTRSPSTTSSNYGPNNAIIKQSSGVASVQQRSLHSQDGARQILPPQENRISRSHPNSLEESGIYSKSSSADDQSTGSLKVIYSTQRNGNDLRTSGKTSGPTSGPGSAQCSRKAQERLSNTCQVALEKSASTCDVTPIRHDVIPDLDLKISESAQAEVGRIVNGSDVTVKVVQVEGQLETQAAKVRSVLQRTVELLAAEIDSCTLVEYLQRSRPGREVTGADWTRCCNPSGAEDIFWNIITQQEGDDYDLFCEIIEAKPHFRYLIDLLQTLDTVVAMVAPESDDDDDDGCHDDEPDCDGCVDATDFDLDLVFCHREVQFISPRDNQRCCSPDLRFDCSNLSLAGGGGGGSSCLPSLTGDEPTQQPKVPMITVSLVNYCLCRRQRASLLHRLLEQSSCLRELSLVKTHLSPTDLEALLRQVSSNPGLARLDLRLSKVDDFSAGLLGDALRRNSALRVLNIASTGLTDIGCSRLMSGLFGNRSVCDIDVGFNDIRDTGCCSIAEVITRSNPLRKVRMRDNGITCYGACALFQSLARNCRLVFLDLSSNRIGNNSLRHLSEALISNRTLRDLNLENCGISSDGCFALARALRANTALRSLQLSLNPISDAGIEVLSDGLRYNHTLDTLSVNMCNITNQGFLRLLDTLRFNFTVRTVKLCYNNIGSDDDNDIVTGLPFTDDICARLYEVLHYNPKLKVLLWGNALDRVSTADPGSMVDQFESRPSPFCSPMLSNYRQEVLVPI